MSSSGRIVTASSSGTTGTGSSGTGSSLVTSGTGSPYKNVTPSGAGALYVDTAATNGASLWQATGTSNTSWVVVQGDSGWRDVTPWVCDPTNGNPSATSGKLYVRRQAGVVSFNSSVVPSGSKYPLISSATFAILPTAGFTSQFARLHVRAWDSGNGFLIGVGGWGTQGVLCHQGTSGNNINSGTNVEVKGEYVTDDPWPTTLPGTAM